MKKTRIVFTTLAICIVSVLAILSGLFVGSNISHKLFYIDKYAGLTKEDLMDDISKINYEGKTPDQFSASDVYNIAINKLQQSDKYNRNSIGELQTSVGVKQFIHSKSGEDGNFHFQESTTYSSMIKRAGRFTYIEGEKINYQEGEAKGSTLEEVDWLDNFTVYEYDEYEELIGREMDYESTYIVSSKTVKNSSQCSVSNNEFTFTINLDASLATIFYIKEISFVSNIDPSTISFQSVTIEFTVDSNFNIIKQKNIENYSLKYSGIPVSINATYNITITY